MSLKGKHILLGITGGIAAYKIPLLVRLLIKSGADVKVMRTHSASDFVTDKTLSALSKHPVYSGFYKENHIWNNHVHLARWADVILIAPLSANTLAKIANGQADNFLIATLMSAECPVLVAPAMDREMYGFPAVRKNLETLKSFGYSVIEAEEGELASGLTGKGRMPEPETLKKYLEQIFSDEQDLTGKKVLITAGPTFEPIDPVRFIGNRSSGKMGVALAEEAKRRGADVTLITGPVQMPVHLKNVEIISVETAEEMKKEVLKKWPQTDILVMAAAVADYRPEQKADKKIKKTQEEVSIRLVKNPDILKEAGKTKKKNQILVGFALETHDEKKHALEKLKKKNLDMIVLNSLQDQGAGFGTDTNKVTIIKNNGEEKTFPLKTKTEVAKDIWNEIKTLL